MRLMPAGLALASVMAATWRFALPPLSLVFAIVLAVSPGIDLELMIAALTPVLVIIFWAVWSCPTTAYQTAAVRASPALAERFGGMAGLPASALFVAGLFVDAVTNAPMGYWSLIYLLARQVAVRCRDIAQTSFVGHMALVAGTVFAVLCVQALIGLAYAHAWPNIADGIITVVLAMPVYGLLAFGLGALTRLGGAEVRARYGPSVVP